MTETGHGIIGHWGIISRVENRLRQHIDERSLQMTVMLPKKRPPTHPGEMLLREYLEPMAVTQKEFAEHLGWTYARLNEIVNGRRNVSADSALAFGEALGTGPELWLNLQRDWDLWHALESHRKVPRLRKTG